MTRTSHRLALGGYAGTVLVLCAACAVLVGPFFTTLFMGALLAGLTAPLHRRLAPRLGEAGAAAATTFLTLLLFIGPLSLIMVGAAAQGREVAERMADERKALTLDGVTRLAGRIPGVEILGGPEKLREQVAQAARAGGKAVSSGILKVAAAIPGALLVTVLALVALFFGLKDGHRLIAWGSKRVPLDQTTREAAWTAISVTAIRTVYATLAAATAQACVVLVAFLSLGIPMAFLAATATWIFAWIPFLGIVPVWVGGLAYLIAAEAGPKVVVWFVVGAVGSVIDNFVRAWVLKGGAKLHPLVALVAIFGGVRLFGLAGVFIGPTVAAVTIAMLDVFPQVRSRPQRKSAGTEKAGGNAPESGVRHAPHAGTA